MSDYKLTNGKYGFLGDGNMTNNQTSAAATNFVQAGVDVANLIISASANKRAREESVKQAEAKLALLWEVAENNQQRMLAQAQEELFYLQMEELEKQEQLRTAKTAGFCIAGVVAGAMLMLLAKS